MFHEALFFIYFQPLKTVKEKKFLAQKSYKNKWKVGLGSWVIVRQTLW